MNRKALVVGAVVGLMAAMAFAGDRGLDERNSIQALNGSLQYLGSIRSYDGGCFNNYTNQVLWDGGVMIDGGAVTIGVDGGPADGGLGTNAAAFLLGENSLTLTQCVGDVRWAAGTGVTTKAIEGQSLRLSGQMGASPYAVGDPHRAWLYGKEDAIGICPLDAGSAFDCNIFRLR